MKNSENIDEILRQGMANFEPEVPSDAWQAIENQLQVHGSGFEPTSKGGSNLLKAFNNLSTLSKLGVVALVPVVAVSAYFLLTDNKPTENKSMVKETAKIEVQAKDLQTEDLDVNTTQSNGFQSKTSAKSKQNQPRIEKSAISTRSESQGVAEPIILQNAAGAINPGLPEKQNGKQEDFSKQAIQSNLEPEVSQLPKNNEVLPDVVSDEIHSPEPEIYNVFSPDGDGKNDNWEIKIENPFYYHVRIFDANGKLVFETDRMEQSWNGSNQKTGMDCEAGQYAYIFDYQLDKNKKMKTKTGFVRLVK